jgi:nucleoid-associated protein YgaU
MSAGTKVTIAVVVLFAALLGVYYGFGGPGTGAVPDEAPPAEVDRAQLGPMDETPVLADPAGDDLPAPPGPLSASVQQALARDPVPPQPKAAAAPADVWVIAPKPAFPEPEPEPRYVDYTIREGDSMWTIAQHWLGDPNRWGHIADANPGADPDRLRVGQRIRIPTEAPAKGPMLNVPARLADGGPQAAAHHVVRSGETLSSIAQAHYRDAGKWRLIYDANRGAIGGDPDRLEVGMRLRLPSG